MTQRDRMEHHRKQIRNAAKWQGIDGVNAYKAQHPEAKRIRVISEPVAYPPKPKGYDAAILALVILWFNSDAALASTNRDDVLRLNAKLGSDFDPDRFFSRAVSKGLREKIAATFTQQGAHLDPSTIKSLSTVRKAVAAAKARAAPAAIPFAGIGTRTGNMLTIGSQTFRIENHYGRECVRLSMNGKRQRIPLDALQIMFAGMEREKRGDTPSYLLCNSIGELARNSESPTIDPPESSLRANSHPPECRELAREVPPPSTADRIAKLAVTTAAGAIAGRMGQTPPVRFSFRIYPMPS
ncbi:MULTISPECIES: hypothetical protein [unclassified Sphingopyxis]|uniref:hypothetical protein n=1 Tax=unclassified Sphingopyxis TaxID=2614943 RepID=UPI00072FBE3F|nr:MULTISPECIES: hypothetical protein [unclassified Sphingopyxis]KTE23896.1 hypothetical protein ATE61_15245 [Sphingopyxis sp. H057]KTE51049.1 hypothetical protein ATE64_14190 [Sphingopyxis sp. H073]KTE51260.1 hypothetical protein ATE69_16160 [Sphingopyxis sp. H071]KTE58833.1 hypothetical protein ATE66_13725 [Sphingopyxis sp. H107]KTE61224.1 hypothetical protein ATE65_18485 [Sphingopyxis sp. H100]